MTSKQFDTIRFYAELVGHILTFLLAVSEIIGFQYGAEFAAIAAAANICIGNIVTSARKKWEDDQKTLEEEDDDDASDI